MKDLRARWDSTVGILYLLPDGKSYDTIYLLVTVNKHIRVDTTASCLRCDKRLVLTCCLRGRWRGRHCLVAGYRGLLWVDGLELLLADQLQGLVLGEPILATQAMSSCHPCFS